MAARSEAEVTTVAEARAVAVRATAATAVAGSEAMLVVGAWEAAAKVVAVRAPVAKAAAARAGAALAEAAWAAADWEVAVKALVAKAAAAPGVVAKVAAAKGVAAVAATAAAATEVVGDRRSWRWRLRTGVARAAAGGGVERVIIPKYASGPENSLHASYTHTIYARRVAICAFGALRGGRAPLPAPHMASMPPQRTLTAPQLQQTCHIRPRQLVVGSHRQWLPTASSAPRPSPRRRERSDARPPRPRALTPRHHRARNAPLAHAARACAE